MPKTTKEITEFTLSEYDDVKNDVWYSKDEVERQNCQVGNKVIIELEEKHQKALDQLQKELKDMLDNWHIRNPATKMCINTVGMRMNDIFAKYLYSPSGLRRIDDESEAVDTPLTLGTKSNSQSNEHIHLFDKDTMICSVCGKKPSDIINKLSQSNPKKLVSIGDGNYLSDEELEIIDKLDKSKMELYVRQERFWMIYRDVIFATKNYKTMPDFVYYDSQPNPKNKDTPLVDYILKGNSQSNPDKDFIISPDNTSSKSGGDALVHGLMSFGILKCKRCQHDIACKKTTKACHYFQDLDMRS